VADINMLEPEELIGVWKDPPSPELEPLESYHIINRCGSGVRYSILYSADGKKSWQVRSRNVEPERDYAEDISLNSDYRCVWDELPATIQKIIADVIERWE